MFQRFGPKLRIERRLYASVVRWGPPVAPLLVPRRPKKQSIPDDACHNNTSYTIVLTEYTLALTGLTFATSNVDDHVKVQCLQQRQPGIAHAGLDSADHMHGVPGNAGVPALHGAGGLVRGRAVLPGPSRVRASAYT